MFKRMPLKRVLGALQRLGNATKKRSEGGDCGIRLGVLNYLNATAFYYFSYDNGISTNSCEGSHDDRTHQ